MMSVTRSERHFWAILLLAAGPVLQFGGWLFTFTDMGAAFVFGGTVMSAVGFVVWPTRATFIAAVAGVLLGGWGIFLLLLVFVAE